MAYYFEIERSSISRLKREWENFIEECYDEVDRQCYESSKSYEKEAREDRFYERYEEDSINEWYRESIKLLDEWAESMKDDFRDTYRKGNEIIEEIASKKFYDNDEEFYSFRLNFCDGEIEKERDDNHSISFGGMSWTIKDVTIKFNPTAPKLTEWKLLKSR